MGFGDERADGGYRESRCLPQVTGFAAEVEVKVAAAKARLTEEQREKILSTGPTAADILAAEEADERIGFRRGASWLAEHLLSDDPANAWCTVCDRGLEGCTHSPGDPS